jgi:ABC-type dipeptide/oligopeptide/nickel transport system permease component
MSRYLFGKLVNALLTLAFVLVFNFFLFRVIPGNPADLLGRDGDVFTLPTPQADHARARPG